MKRLFITLTLLIFSGPAFAATCMISEYQFVRDPSAPVAPEPAITTQSVTYTTSTQSSTLNALTRFVRIVCDAKAHFEFGTAPTATATDPYVSADTPEYFGINGTSIIIAFYDGTS